MRCRTAAAVAAALLLAVALPGCSGDDPRDPGAVELPEGRGGLLGNVVARDGHQTPVEGVMVLITPAGGVHTTDDRGKFVQRDLAPGHYKAQPSKSGYAGEAREFDVAAGNYTEIVIFMDRL